MKDEITAYPLCWPLGYKRTEYPEISSFRTSPSDAREGMYAELERLGSTGLIVSTNMKIRKDGMPYLSQGRIDDVGVAVYFVFQGEQRVLACDAWDTIGDNMQAIRKTIEALRGIDRWGVSEMLSRAFVGFQALPAQGQTTDPSETAWWEELELGSNPDEWTKNRIKAAYRRLVVIYHPEGSDPDEAKFMRIVQARDAGLAQVQ